MEDASRVIANTFVTLHTLYCLENSHYLSHVMPLDLARTHLGAESFSIYREAGTSVEYSLAGG
jgi:hypothetical protein